MSMDIKPIEFDELFDRAYIPVNSRYEVQTRGKGSSFRIANTMTHERWLITDERLHHMLTELAYGTHAELVQAQAEITRLQSLIADMQKIDDVMMGENERDAKRYRWLKPQILGSEYRRIGIIYGDFMSGIDKAVDEAMRGEV